MNEQPNDANGIITTAEELVRGLFAAERDGDVHDAPSSFEAVEDEVKALEAAVNADFLSAVGEDFVRLRAAFRAFVVHRVLYGTAPLWRVRGCMENDCDRPGCTERHHNPSEFFVEQGSDGVYRVLAEKVIFNVADQNQACFEQPGRPSASIALSDLVNALSDGVVKRIVAELGEAEQDDDLPLTATTLPSIDIEEHSIIVTDDGFEVDP